nr:hypothetical protein [uncultured Pseudomonas sp.]
MAALKSPQTFAAKLLQAALKRQYGVDEDVRYLKLADNQMRMTPESKEQLSRLIVLEYLDLSDNEIMELPSDLLEMSLPLDDVSDLSGNPLSAQSIELLRDYYRQTGYELGVEEAMVDAFGVALQVPGTPRPMEE